MFIVYKIGNTKQNVWPVGESARMAKYFAIPVVVPFLIHKGMRVFWWFIEEEMRGRSGWRGYDVNGIGLTGGAKRSGDSDDLWHLKRTARKRSIAPQPTNPSRYIYCV